jgi:hypothetical protein
MISNLLFSVAFLGLVQNAIAAQDVIVDARSSHLVFKGGDELYTASDGLHLLSVKLIHAGRTTVLKGDVLAGLDYPNLTSVKLELVGVNRCKLENACLDYSIPKIVIDVGGVPEENECLDPCRVGFVLTEGKVLRTTRSGNPRIVLPYPSVEFPLP